MATWTRLCEVGFYGWKPGKLLFPAEGGCGILGDFVFSILLT